jgi:hypothetical protein
MSHHIEGYTQEEILEEAEKQKKGEEEKCSNG